MIYSDFCIWITRYDFRGTKMLRRFFLNRKIDASGVSGVGKVAEGCIFLDTGEVVVHWLGAHSCTNLYHCMDDVVYIHSHHGMTDIVYYDSEEQSDKKN